MNRANFKGAVRNSSAEAARDKRMLELFEQGLVIQQIATRMGVAGCSVSQRIGRARAAREAGTDN